MKYRAEIDGLRALAVLPVILFHAGFSLFSGGFVGVDVFFVVSGYLITSILINDIEARQFNLVHFYERRARRILPALFFVMAVSVPFAWMWLLPIQLKDFAQSLVAVSFFSSNILFWLESGYFEVATDHKPLLHTWSLGVEEQFYLLFPLFLLLVWRLGKERAFWVLIACAVASLVYSEWASRHSPSANFYLAPSRAWELLAGSLSAFLIRRDIFRPHNILATIGLICIVCSVFIYDETTPFPSLYTLLPVVGVVLVILFAGKDTFVARFLSVKPLVGVGLISYSAYLWHQPLFAFAKNRLLEPPSSAFMLLLTVLSLILAYASWRWIEQPFRDQKIMKRLHIAALTIMAMGVMTAIGLYGHVRNGFEDRLPGWDHVTSIEHVTQSYCHNAGRRSPNQLAAGDFCQLGDGEAHMAIFGDSMAGALYAYADDYLRQNKAASLAISGGLCAPLMNGFTARDACTDAIKIAFQKVLENPNVTTVILAAEWAMYTQGFRDELLPRRWRDDAGMAINIADNVNLFERSLKITIDRLVAADKQVRIMMPVPEFDHHSYDYVGKKILHDKLSLAAATRSLPGIAEAAFNSRNAEVLKVFSQFEDQVRFVPVKDIFCRNERCYPFAENNDVPYYSDRIHVNYEGAKPIVSRLFGGDVL